MAEAKSEVEVYRSARLYEAEMVVETLKEKEIPSFLVQEAVTGLRTSPVLPPQGAVGEQYVVMVSAQMKAQALEVIKVLPVKNNPGPGALDYTSSPKARNDMKLVVWTVLLIFLIVLIFACFDMTKGLLSTP